MMLTFEDFISLLPFIGLTFLLGGLIGGIHEESWGIVLFMPEKILYGVVGFSVCIAVFIICGGLS